MDALVMAGGKGSRLQMGEKPLVQLKGVPLIERVVSTLRAAQAGDIYVAVTASVHATGVWARENDLFVVETPGIGYVADMVKAVEIASICEPVLIIMADLPLVTPDILEEIFRIYDERPEPALSTHTPIELHRRIGRSPDSIFNYKGRLIVPAGINVLDGANITNEQEDYHLIMDRLELAVNVNTAEDLSLCEDILEGRIS